MTGAEFSEVDFDLLADYVGGALTGTPDEATVAALIADEPAWQAAHDELAGAMASVGAELNALGAVSEPMPPEVARRLDAAFASAVSDPAPIDPEFAAPAVPFVVASEAGAASGRHLSAVPDDVDLGVGERRRVTGGERRRSLRWAVPIAVAAGVIAFAGYGVNYLNDRSQPAADNAASSAAGSSRKQAEADAPMIAQDSPGVVSDDVLVATGRDYQLSTLASASTRLPAGASVASSKGPARPAAPTALSSAPLARLSPAEALGACLEAISRENAAGQITASVVDFARFAGDPAVIVRFTAANGEWVWAAGPDCGLPTSRAAKLAAVKVG